MALISQLVMQILNVYTISIGKLFNGFFVIVVHMSVIKMINETVPVYLLNRYGPFIATAFALGYMSVLILGVGLP